MLAIVAMDTSVLAIASKIHEAQCKEKSISCGIAAKVCPNDPIPLNMVPRSRSQHYKIRQLFVLASVAKDRSVLKNASKHNKTEKN